MNTSRPRHDHLADAILGAVTYIAECYDTAMHFPSYDHADTWLDNHEQLCPLAHTIYRATAIITTRQEEHR